MSIEFVQNVVRAHTCDHNFCLLQIVMSKLTILVVVGLVVLVALVNADRRQSIGVRGRLICGDSPLSATTVKLYNKKKLGECELSKNFV